VRFLLQRLANMVREIDNRNIDNIDGWSGNQTNVTTDRAFDADSTSTAELADVLGTLIADLITKGVLT
jgi:hypothetical protein